MDDGSGHDTALCGYYGECYCGCEDCAEHHPVELSPEELELMRKFYEVT